MSLSDLQTIDGHSRHQYHMLISELTNPIIVLICFAPSMFQPWQFYIYTNVHEDNFSFP